MNVLQLATVDNGGATWFYRDALLAHTDHDCRAVRTYQGVLDYPADVLAPDREELGRLYRWADVIHLHDEAGALIGPKWRAKPTVITYHGTRYRQFPEQFNERCRRKGWLLTVSTLDLTEWGGIWLPTPRRDLADQWNPAEGFVVCQAPTDRERKRTDMLLEAMLHVPKCRLELIEGTPYRRAMQKKARASCLVDGWHYGYGNNAIEAWAFGMPVVARARPEVRDLMIWAWGSLPFVEADPEPAMLAVVLDRLRTDPQAYEAARQAGRQHYERYHRPDKVAARLSALYTLAAG